MVVKSASVAVALVLSLIGASPFEGRVLSPRAATAAPIRLAAASKLWAPKKSKPKSGDDEGDSAKEEELLKPRAPTPASSRSSGAARSGGAPRPHRRIKMEDEASSDSEDESEEGDDEDDEDQARITKRRKRVVDEEEEDEEEDAPLPSLPVIRPRLVSGQIGAAALGRSFHYNTPLQGDSVFPRMGFSLALEAFPLLRTSGVQRKLGLGVSYERQTGTASIYQMADGSTVSYPVSQGRWGFDVRYAFPLGPRVVLLPAVGYGKASADLSRRTPVAPSMCIATNAQPCFADAQPSYVSIDLHLRVAATPAFSLSLVGGYMLGLSVARGMDQISAEGSASMRGFHADVGASFLVRDWFALAATVPIRYYGYTLTPTAGGAATYRAASDLTYGLVAGVALLAP